MDLIDREQAINALDELCERVCQYSKEQRAVMCGACPLGDAFDVIDNMPSAEKTGKWTLFKDKVPPETGRYFITLDLGYAKNLVSNDVWISRDCEWSVYDNEDVIAWMPIEYPEQYKEGD